MTTSRVVLITGCSSGIGLATAVAFAQQGDIVVATLRDRARAGALRSAAASAAVELDESELDVADDRSVSDGVEGVIRRHGRLDVVVNNAGVGVSGTLEELSMDDLRTSIETNYLGVARVTKAALPLMRAAGGGRIIAVSSIAGAFGQPFNDAYCASKFAVEGLYESLHPAVAPFGIHLSLVEPGPVTGEFREHSAGVDGRTATGPYAAQWGRFLATADGGYADAQTPEEVAGIIVDVAGSELPHLRYQTSPLVERLVGLKVADMRGDRVTRATSRWLA
jgi:NAD(P)-dependent dehydrogenase (short-subunit alcohol dehydrogenase family)